MESKKLKKIKKKMQASPTEQINKETVRSTYPWLFEKAHNLTRRVRAGRRSRANADADKMYVAERAPQAQKIK